MEQICPYIFLKNQHLHLELFFEQFSTHLQFTVNMDGNKSAENRPFVFRKNGLKHTTKEYL